MQNLFFSGWITGHTYVTYGPLLNGATSVIFEGIPFYPSNDRCWQIVQKYKVIKCQILIKEGSVGILDILKCMLNIKAYIKL